MINTKSIDQNSKKDLLLWILGIGLIIAGIWAYYHFSDVAWALRAAGGIVLLCIVVPILLQTKQGKKFWHFLKEARMELRKVVWPTRQEVIQTTFVVIAMVVVMSLILWGVDSILMWIVSWFTGQRG